jgi:hypothetical protein
MERDPTGPCGALVLGEVAIEGTAPQVHGRGCLDDTSLADLKPERTSSGG